MMCSSRENLIHDGAFFHTHLMLSKKYFKWLFFIVNSMIVYRTTYLYSLSLLRKPFYTSSSNDYKWGILFDDYLNGSSMPRYIKCKRRRQTMVALETLNLVSYSSFWFKSTNLSRVLQYYRWEHHCPVEWKSLLSIEQSNHTIITCIEHSHWK